jgi:RNA polymerase sigma factor (sigma-70 family)
MPTNESPAADDTTRLDVHAAVRRLPARQQEAVVLHYLLDLSVADTAAAMGCDQGTVKTHLSRARAALLRALSIDDEPSPHTRSRDHG